MCFAVADNMKIHAKTAAVIGAGLIIMQPITAIFPAPSLFFIATVLWLVIAFLIKENTFPALAIFVSGLCYLVEYGSGLEHPLFRVAERLGGSVFADLFGIAALLWIGGDLLRRRWSDVFDTNRADKFSANPGYSMSRPEVDNHRSERQE